jgi:FSR family fosmidomycin resistance protein-like MFS transporter
MAVIEQTVVPESERFQTEPVVTLAVAHGSHDTYFSFIPVMLPGLMEKLSLTTAEAGALSIFYQGPALIQPFIGYLADRVNLRSIIILAPALSGAMVSLVGSAPNYALVAFLLVIAGLSNAGFHAVAPAMITHFSGKKLGRGMSFFMVGGELGFALGPMAAVPVIQANGLSGMTSLMLLGISVSAVLYLRLRGAQKWQLPASKPTDLSLRAGLRQMSPVMLPLVGFAFINSFLYAHLSTYLPTFLTGEGASLMLAGASFSAFQLAGTSGTLVSGWLSDRFGRREILLFAAIATPLFALLFLVGAPWMRVPALMGAGFASFCTTPSLMAMVQENFPHQRAMANGMYMMINFVVRSIVIILVGALADRIGLRSVFTASAFFSFLTIPFIFLLPRR